MIRREFNRAVPLLLCLVLASSPACHQAEPPPPISLLDQVDSEELLGPWRLSVRIHGLRSWANGAEGLGIRVGEELIDAGAVGSLTRTQIKNANRSKGKGDAFIQTARQSIVRRPLIVDSGELLILGLRYTTDWIEAPRVELRLLRSGEAVATTEADVNGHWCEGLLAVPPGGADGLEIRHHLMPGTLLPLHSATVMVVEGGVEKGLVSRAQLYLRLARSDLPFPVARINNRRVFPLPLDGRTLETMLLASGETRELAVPPALTGRKLRCWYTVLDGGRGGSTNLTLEGEVGGQWQSLAKRPILAREGGAWTVFSLDGEPEIPNGCDRIRISLGGNEAIIGVSGLILPAGRRASNRKNLLVIDLDTLRADRMGTYGYAERPTTAGLDAELEQRGYHLFENTYSPASFTLPATAMFLSGRYHDIHQNLGIPRSYTLLQEMLRQAGYYCVAFTGGGQLRYRGFEQGFHGYSWSKKVGKVEDTFPKAINWLERNRKELFFLFLHTYETHLPFTRGEFCTGLPCGRLGDILAGEPLLPENGGIRNDSQLTKPEKQYIDAAYDSGVKTAADAVSELLKELDRLGLTRSTVVVILSDHGEEFWDHNELFARHGQSLYGELINVPLIIFDPDRPSNGLHRITNEASTVDLVPTVLDLLDLPLATAADGASLVPLIEEKGDQFHREIPVLASGLDKSYCVIHDGVKYIRNLGSRPWLALGSRLPPGLGELYRLADDPGEKNNLVEIEPELRQRMAEVLSQAAADALPPLVGETVKEEPDMVHLKRQLRSLGYVEGE